MDDSLFERRVSHWKRLNVAAREAERAASAALETQPDQPLAQKAARLRRIADVVMKSIVEDVRNGKHTFTLIEELQPLSALSEAETGRRSQSDGDARAEDFHRFCA